MFDVDSTAPVDKQAKKTAGDGTKGLPCPKSSELPTSLMEEYQAMLASPVQHKLTLSVRDEAYNYDDYAIDNRTSSLADVFVQMGHAPADVNSVTVLYGRLNDHRQDGYKNGERNSSKFVSDVSSAEKQIVVDANVENESGKDRIVSETGLVLDRTTEDMNVTGYFKAAFDKDGHLASYQAGPDSKHLVDAKKTCADK